MHGTALPSGMLRVGHTEEAVPSFTREEILAARLRIAKVLPYQQSSTPFVSNLSLAIGSGLLLVFAFPEWNLWSLAWVGPAPLLMAVAREQRFWRSALLGTITGTIFYLGTSHWITYSMHNYGGIALWLCYVISGVFALVLGLFTGLFSGVVALAVKRFSGWGLLVSPFVWPATEWLRLQVTGMGWNNLGYSQAFHPPVIQVARWGGVYLVSALLVLASTALVFGMIYLERLRGLLVFSIAGLIIVGSVLYGQSVITVTQGNGSFSVAVIQPNVPISDHWDDPDFILEQTRAYVSLSERTIRESNHDATVDLVIWPEAQLNFEYDRDPRLRLDLAEFTRNNDVHLLVNSWGYPDDSGPRNSAMLIGPSGDRITQYDKIALVPFGEYVPARGFIPFMNQVPAMVGDVTAGSHITLSEVAGTKLGTFICFEATRPEIARQMRRAGASALVQLSNEAWFGPTAAPRQMLAHALLRAVENDADLIRATNSGLSARIDRLGQVEGLTPSFDTATRRWKINPAGSETTFYTRNGDVFAVACLVISLAALAAGVSSLFLLRKEAR